MTMIHKPKHHGDDSGHWVDVEVSPRRVHVVFGGETIADSKRVLLVREALTVPAYYFPREDVRADLIVPTGHRTRCPYKGNASYWTVKVGNRVAENTAWSYLEPPPECAQIQGAMAFVWKMMDSWYEEKEEILVHPRDPYKRVDVLSLHAHRHPQELPPCSRRRCRRNHRREPPPPTPLRNRPSDALLPAQGRRQNRSARAKLDDLALPIQRPGILLVGKDRR